MWRFLKEAFFFRIPTRFFGELPLNVLALAGMTALGFGQPGFWFLGLGLELSYLLMVAGNPRFQRLVLQRAREKQRESNLTRLTRVLESFSQFVSGQTHAVTRVIANTAQIPQLQEERAGPGVARKLYPGHVRYNALAERVTQILDRYRSDQVDDELARSNQESLHALLLIYAELLYNQSKLATLEDAAARLPVEIERLRAELARGSLNAELAESKQATLSTLEKRLAARQKRAVIETQISSDLQRVEQQIELAWEAALVSGDIGRINTDLNIASMFLTDEIDLNLFGSLPTPTTAPLERELPSRAQQSE